MSYLLLNETKKKIKDNIFLLTLLFENNHVSSNSDSVGVQGLEKKTLPSFGKIWPTSGYAGVARRGGCPVPTGPEAKSHGNTVQSGD